MKLDGVVDERDETPTTAARTILPDDRISRERRQSRFVAQFGLLDTSDKHVVSREEVVEFSRGIANPIAVPGDETLRRRRRRKTRTRIRVDAPDEKEDEDEATREGV